MLEANTLSSKYILVNRIFGILMLLLLAGTCTYAQVPAATIPNFEFETNNKTLFVNKHLPSGKKIFFVFFDTECGHCQEAITYLDAHLQAFEKAAIFLISVDMPFKVKPFLDKYGGKLTRNKNVTVLRDYKNIFITTFKPRKYPSMFLYSSAQKLVYYSDEPKDLPMFLLQVKETGK